MHNLNFPKALIVTFGIVISLFAMVITPQAMAQDENAQPEVQTVVAGDQPIRFALKRMSEKTHMIWLQLVNKGQIGTFAAELADRRFKELQFILAREYNESYIETTVSRYITYLGLLGEKFDNKQVSAEIIQKTITPHKELLPQFRDQFPSQTAQWIMLEQALDSVTVLHSRSQTSS